jgi:hypothetical protein
MACCLHQCQPAEYRLLGVSRKQCAVGDLGNTHPRMGTHCFAVVPGDVKHTWRAQDQLTKVKDRQRISAELHQGFNYALDQIVCSIQLVLIISLMSLKFRCLNKFAQLII